MFLSIDGLVHDCSISSVLVLQPYIKPLISYLYKKQQNRANKY